MLFFLYTYCCTLILLSYLIFFVSSFWGSSRFTFSNPSKLFSSLIFYLTISFFLSLHFSSSSRFFSFVLTHTLSHIISLYSLHTLCILFPYSRNDFLFFYFHFISLFLISHNSTFYFHLDQNGPITYDYYIYHIWGNNIPLILPGTTIWT